MYVDIGENLISQHAQKKLERQEYFLKLLSIVRFLASQCLSLCIGDPLRLLSNG